jgi:ArsR family transcriptional regulator
MDTLFKALSEQNRLRILSLLMHGEMCVCEIECSLQLTQSTASRHLSALKQCNILERYKKSQWTYYKISERFMEEHQLLWKYLESELPKLPTYGDDFVKYQNCKTENNCCNKNTPH